MKLIEKIKNNLKIIIISSINIFLLLACNIILIISILKFSTIENTIRYIVIIITVLISIISSIITITLGLNNNNKLNIICNVIIIIFSICFLFISYNLDKIFNTINSLNKEYLTYSSSLVVLKENDYTTLNDLKDKKIGILKDEDSPDGYLIPNLIIEENNLNNELVRYDEFIYMLNSLYNGELDAIFLPTNYVSMYSSIERYEDIADDTKVLISKDKDYPKSETIVNTNIKLNEPFTILIMGLDSIDDNISSSTAFNGDAIMLVTFNPNTLNATILSIPRDTYVPISCFKNKYENKIAHASWGGSECMINTLEDLMDIQIDYYIKINFKGVVNLVNTLDGIDIDVPFSFCEQDSKRRWDKNTIFVEKGFQTLNGEQVLALARHRKETSYMRSYCGKDYIGNNVSDIIRGQNQQLIIKSLFNKFKTINNLDTVYGILDIAKNNIDTNLNTESILSLYNVMKDILNKSNNNNVFNIQRLYLSGYDQYIYDENMHLTLYNYIYYRGSLKDIVHAMKINLGIEESEAIKTFSYSINDEYTEDVIGKGTYPVVDYIDTLPDFTNKTRYDIDSWSKGKNITINYIIKETDDDEISNNQVLNQSLPWGYRVSKIKSLDITIAKKIEKPTYIDCTIEDNYDDTRCILPDFTGWTIDKFDNWYNTLIKYNISFMSPIKEEVSLYEYDDNIITNQSKKAGTNLNDIVSLIIYYNKK